MIVDYRVFLKEAVCKESLDLCRFSLTTKVMDQTAIAFKAHADKVIPANGVSNFEAFALGRGVYLCAPDIAW